VTVGSIIGGSMTWLWVAVVLGCTPRVPGPPIGTHAGEAPTTVPYPPPPGRTDELPPQPSEQDVWIDGQYTWDGKGYTWTAGSWVTPPPGRTYAPARLLRRRNGELLYYEGHWHTTARPEDGVIEPPPPDHPTPP